MVVALSFAAPSFAHDGPPYPIFVDEPLRDWTISIWTDPDVGTGTFFYYVDAPPGRSPSELVVRVSARSPEDLTDAVSASSVLAEPGEPFQLIGELEFAHRGIWQTNFRFEREGPNGPELLGELNYPLDVTPPGLGTIDILWFAFPFLAVAGLWVRALLAQRAFDRTAVRAKPAAD